MSKKATRDKLELLSEACRDPSLADHEFRFLFALLCEFRNGKTGKCCPTDAELGRAAGGKSERTAGTQSRSLQERGWLTKERSRGAPNYQFPRLEDRQPSADLKPDDRQPSADLKKRRSATSRRKIGKVASEDRQQRCRTEPLKEPLKVSPPISPSSDLFKEGAVELVEDARDDCSTTFQNYNIAAGELGLAKAIGGLFPDRRKKLAAILKAFRLDGWNTALNNLYDMPFCCGENTRGWRVSLAWLLVPGNFIKVLEKAYEKSERAGTDFDRMMREEGERAAERDERRKAAGLNGRGPIIDHDPIAPKRSNGHKAPTPEELLRCKLDRLQGALARCTNDAARADLEQQIQQARKELGA
jgi:hypothetical protein